MQLSNANIIKYAAASRILVFFIQIGFTNLGESYDSSSFQQAILSHGYKNATLNTKGLPNRTLVDQLIQSSFNGYMNWDSLYFLSIASYGYEYEQMLAFFPLFPIATALIKKLLAIITFGVFSDLSLMIIAAACINMVSFSLAAVFLHKLTLLLGKGHTFADITTVLFFLNPANVFFSMFYTEPIYAFFQFTGMYAISLGSQTDLKYILAGILFAAGSATRSNGLTSVGFLIYSFLTELFDLTRDCKGKNRNFKCIARIGRRMIVFVLSVLFVVFSFVLFQYFAYQTYCLGKSSLIKADHWCHQTFPNSYSYIQRYYWNVGPFMYFEIKQIPNFALALPVILLSYAAIESFFKSVSKDVRQFLKEIFLEEGISKLRRSKNNSTMMHNPRLLPFVIHLLFLATFGVINIHVQVLTRMLFSSSPVLLWYSADQLSEGKHNSSWMKKHLILGYFISYTLIGCLLHCNFYPWT